MVTRVSNPLYPEASHSAIRTTAEWKEQSRPLLSRPRILKWVGMISTGLICAAALAPHAFGIPANFRAWVFVTAIFWFLAFCAGMFEY